MALLPLSNWWEGPYVNQEGSVGKHSLLWSVLSSWLGGGGVMPSKGWKAHQGSISHVRSPQYFPCCWVCAQWHPARRKEAADTGRWDLWCKGTGEMTFDRSLHNDVPSSHSSLWLGVWGQFLSKPDRVSLQHPQPPIWFLWLRLAVWSQISQGQVCWACKHLFPRAWDLL